MCLDFRSITANKKLIYYEGTVFHNDMNERVKVWLQSVYDGYVTAGTVISEACDDNVSIRQRTYLVLVETGATAADVAINCPFPTTDSDYSSSECSTPGTVDWQLLSTAPTALNLNNSNCGTQQGFSGTGTLYCIHDVSEGSASYLTTYNIGDTYDGSTTFRFTCIAYQSSGADYINTQHPEHCLGDQTGVAIASPGIQFNLTYIVPTTTTSTTMTSTTDTSTDTSTSSSVATTTTGAAAQTNVVDKSDSSDTLWIILGVVLGVILVLLIVGMVIGLLCWRIHRKKKSTSIDVLPRKVDKPKKPKESSVVQSSNYGYNFGDPYHPPAVKQSVPPPNTFFAAPVVTKPIAEAAALPQLSKKKTPPKKKVTKKQTPPKPSTKDVKPVSDVKMKNTQSNPAGLYRDFFKTHTLTRVNYINTVKNRFIQSRVQTLKSKQNSSGEGGEGSQNVPSPNQKNTGTVCRIQVEPAKPSLIFV